MSLTYSDWSSIIQACSNVAIAVIAGTTASFARKQLKATKKAQIAQLKPNVAVIYERDRGNPAHYNLVVKNFGPGVAKNIKLNVDKSIRLFDKKPLAESSLFKNAIPFLGVGDQLTMAFNVAGSRFDSSLPQSFHVIVQCFDVQDRLQKDCQCAVNLHIYQDLIYWKNDFLSPTAEEMDEQKKSWIEMAKTFKQWRLQPACFFENDKVKASRSQLQKLFIGVVSLIIYFVAWCRRWIETWWEVRRIFQHRIQFPP